MAENLIKVQEAIWVDSDLIQTMPAPYIKDFQQKVAARYAGLRGPRNRRLFIARKGPTRTIQNFEQLQAFLARYEFETVYLEGKTVLDQNSALSKRTVRCWCTWCRAVKSSILRAWY